MSEESASQRGLVLFEHGITPATTDKPLVISALILDRSGSMQRYGMAPVSAVNEFLDALRGDEAVEYYASLVTFADEPKVEIPLAPIAEIGRYANYCVEGGTLLWRTVKHVLQQLIKGYDDSPLDIRQKLRVVVGVFSDGADNRSPQRLYPVALRAQSAIARDRGFTLQAFGIGIDSKVLAREMGFPSDLAQTHEGTARGVHDSVLDFSSTTKNVGADAARYRRGRGSDS